MKSKHSIQAALLAALLSGCATQRNRAILHNKEIARRYFESWANRGDLAVADELIATNVVLRNPPFSVHTLSKYKQGMAAFHTAFPDCITPLRRRLPKGTTSQFNGRWEPRIVGNIRDDRLPEKP